MKDATKQPGIVISQVFLERALFSHREDALQLAPNTPFQPTLAVGIQGGVSPDEKTGFIRISVQTKPEERPLYSIDVAMMALFAVAEKEENLPLKQYLHTAAPAMLYPFVREAVASITWRGRFGPVWLAPFNISVAMAEPSGEAPIPLPKIRKAPKVAKRQPKSAAR